MDVARAPRLEGLPRPRRQLLRRHPAQRAAARLRLRDRRAADQDAALAHVAELEHTTLEQNVRGLEVAMHNLVRVQVLDPVEQLLRRALPLLRRRQLRHPHRQVARDQRAARQAREVAELHVDVDEELVLVLAVVAHDVPVPAVLRVRGAAQRVDLLRHELRLGSYSIVTLETQRLNMIGNLV